MGDAGKVWRAAVPTDSVKLGPVAEPKSGHSPCLLPSTLAVVTLVRIWVPRLSTASSVSTPRMVASEGRVSASAAMLMPSASASSATTV